MSLVIDSSMTLAWYFEDEKTDECTAVLHQVVREGAVVPPLWWLEVANGLQVAVRRRRIDAAYRDISLRDLQRLSVRIEPGSNRQAWPAILNLSDRFRLTIYDAAYLELALRRGLPLATLDGELIQAARAENVPLIGAA